ncbi:MAG: hypothetical protein CM15mP6_2320 [Methanobacteriota archaeon]|nr:MAG: hypothetical protein CM15mP6_2320 [Euryarchaeota archaeon]
MVRDSNKVLNPSDEMRGNTRWLSGNMDRFPCYSNTFKDPDFSPT